MRPKTLKTKYSDSSLPNQPWAFTSGDVSEKKFARMLKSKQYQPYTQETNNSGRPVYVKGYTRSDEDMWAVVRKPMVKRK